MKAAAFTEADWLALEERLADALTPHRFRHTLHVADMASALAMCHGHSLPEARLAGLLHDCAKRLPREEMQRIVEEGATPMRAEEKQNPALWHAPVGAYLARTIYEVEEEEILSAIRYHTTGHPDMTLLEKIVYIADFIEPDRTHTPRLREIRALAFTDPDACVAAIAESTLQYLEEKHKTIDPATRDTWTFYRNTTDGRS